MWLFFPNQLNLSTKHISPHPLPAGDIPEMAERKEEGKGQTDRLTRMAWTGADKSVAICRMVFSKQNPGGPRLGGSWLELLSLMGSVGRSLAPFRSLLFLPTERQKVLSTFKIKFKDSLPLSAPSNHSS